MYSIRLLDWRQFTSYKLNSTLSRPQPAETIIRKKKEDEMRNVVFFRIK